LEWLEKKHGFSVTYLDVNEKGRVNTKDFETSIKPNTILATIMHANNVKHKERKGE